MGVVRLQYGEPDIGPSWVACLKSAKIPAR